MFKTQSVTSTISIFQSVIEKLINNYYAQFKVLVGRPQYKQVYTVYNNTKKLSSVFPGNIKNVSSSRDNYAQPVKKLIVQIPYYTPKGIPFLLTDRKMNALGLAITKVYQQKDKTSCVEVRFIRLRYPYLDRTILRQFLALNASKYNFSRLQKGLFKNLPVVKSSHTSDLSSNMISGMAVVPGDRMSSTAITNNSNSLPSLLITGDDSSIRMNANGVYTTGIKFELAGRLTTQRNIPRKTVENSHTGSFNVSKELQLSNGLDFSQYASKNKLGAFTMKVWLSHSKKA